MYKSALGCVTCATLLTACTGSQGSSYVTASKTPSPAVRAKTGSESTTTSETQGSAQNQNASEAVVQKTPAPAVMQQPQVLEVTPQLKQECLFAVSGTWVGYGDYNDTFPNLQERDKPVGHAGRFDTVGGIYLAAREEPYIHGQGAKELDDAVKYTFDSIVVGPGMNVEIRDERKAVLYSGSGPVIGESSFYAENPTWQGKYLQRLNERKATLPSWMQKWLSDGNTPISVKNLHGARWVKVSAVAGGQCVDVK